MRGYRYGMEFTFLDGVGSGICVVLGDLSAWSSWFGSFRGVFRENPMSLTPTSVALLKNQIVIVNTKQPIFNFYFRSFSMR